MTSFFSRQQKSATYGPIGSCLRNFAPPKVRRRKTLQSNCSGAVESRRNCRARVIICFEAMRRFDITKFLNHPHPNPLPKGRGGISDGPILLLSAFDLDLVLSSRSVS